MTPERLTDCPTYDEKTRVQLARLNRRLVLETDQDKCWDIEIRIAELEASGVTKGDAS